MPYHKIAMKSIVPKGTAPEDPAVRRNTFNKNMIVNTTVGKTIAVRSAFFLRFVPPSEVYSLLEK